LLQPAVTERITGWWAMKDMMLSGRWMVFKQFNQPFLDELTSAPRDEKVPEDIKGRGNDPNVKDHTLDEERYICKAIWRPRTPASMAGTPDWMQRMIRKQSGGEGGPGWKPGQG